MKRIYIILLLCLSTVAALACERVGKRVLLYPSVDQFGEPITLSGMISWPQKKQPKGIILLPHFTIFANSEAPSQNGTGEEKNFQKDFVLIMPDYIGYGATKERVHPYLDGELTARNCIDMTLHAMPILDSLQLRIPKDSIYIVGFSQGGAAAVWILKTIEERYADRIHVKKCFAGSGPHDVAATYDEGVQNNRILMPVTIPLLIKGTDAAYALNLYEEHFFTPEMQQIYEQEMVKKEKTFGELFIQTINFELSHWLTAKGMDKNDPETHRLYQGFLRSSLVHYPLDTLADNKPDSLLINLAEDRVIPTWEPRTPMLVFHSTNDNVVTFRCAENLHRRYADNPHITWDFGEYGDHLSSSNRFFKLVREQLLESHKSKKSRK